MVGKLKNVNLGQISKNIRNSKAFFNKLLKNKVYVKKSPMKRKPGLLHKNTLTNKQEKPLISDAVKRKVTEIVKKGIFDKIRLMTNNSPGKKMLNDLSEVRESSMDNSISVSPPPGTKSKFSILTK